VWSWTWDVPERTWTEVVQPALEALRALPDRDQPRDTAHRRALLVFQVPGAHSRRRARGLRGPPRAPLTSRKGARAQPGVVRSRRPRRSAASKKSGSVRLTRMKADLAPSTSPACSASEPSA
jgi:hypothetical protein